MSLFEDYGLMSGQKLSLGKSTFYAGSISQSKVLKTSRQLGFSIGSLPFTYLGVPIFKGKPRVAHLQPIADRIKAKLAAWKGYLLSIMGRLQLVKSIIHGMLAYNFHVYCWPIKLLKSIDMHQKLHMVRGYCYKEVSHCTLASDLLFCY